MGTISRESRVQGIVFDGSRAKKTFRLGSDIDLCLEAPGLDSPALLRIENELDELLLPWKIDIAIRDRIDDPDLLEHIARVGKTLYRRETSL
ncbi:MAG: nucleotidyltransferase domain-containing protein [Spirochaetia bacterium]